MNRRRFVALALLLGLAAVVVPASRAQAVSGPAAVPQSLCDALIASMKQGAALSFKQRYDLLAPEVSKDLDLGLMTRLVVGPPWKTLAAKDQQDLVKAFSDYSIATYAQRFKSFSGERFEVDPTATAGTGGTMVVHTKLFTGDPDPVQLDYLMKKEADGWRIIDVFLSGTISELAARRSEYSTTLRQGGAPALVDLLQKKTADFGR